MLHTSIAPDDVVAGPYWDRRGLRIATATPAARFLRACVEAAYPVDPDEAEVLLDTAAELADAVPALPLARLARCICLGVTATPGEGVAAGLALDALTRRSRAGLSRETIAVRLTRPRLATPGAGL
jgi:hypothetical protein